MTRSTPRVQCAAAGLFRDRHQATGTKDADGPNHYPPRHINMFNVLYCDGHVTAMVETDLRTEMFYIR